MTGEKRSPRRIAAVLLADGISLFLGLYGSLFCLITAFQLPADRPLLTLGCLLVALAYLLVCSLPRLRLRLPLYLLALAFTAGLFETAGRYCVLRWLVKAPLDLHSAVAAGLGHGGSEAMLLVGTTYINNLVLSLLINSGSAIAAAPAIGPLANLLAGTPAILYLSAGYERLCTMAFHIALTALLVSCWSRGGRGRGFWACVGLHTLTDTLVPLANLYVGQWLAFVLLTVIGAASLVYLLRSKRGPAPAQRA